MNKIAKMLCMAVLAAGLAGCGNAKEMTENDYDVDGVYQMEVATKDSDNTVWAYHFWKENGTFSETVTIGDESYELLNGTYEIDEDNGLVHTKADSGNVQDFIIAGEYLLADGFFYEGEIPEGETFDAVCAYTGDAGTTSTVDFSKDGRYTFEGSIRSAGTYKREENMITMENKNGSSVVNFVIYNGKISNSYFVKNEK